MISRQDIEKSFAAIERAAVNGERCPTNRGCENPTGTLRKGAASALAREGRIRVEVYARNWRVAEILTGPNAGRRTQSPPAGAGVPYRVVQRS